MENKTKKFIENAIKVHGNTYDYSLVDYISSNKKIKIICNLHGIFEQEANSHLQGKKCKECSIVERTLKRKDSVEGFIKKSKDIHGDKYDYSLVDYKNNKTLVKIQCEKHGVFEQRPDCHIYHKQGCPKCGGTSKISLKEFIDRANERHENFFNYSSVTFNSIKDKIEIVCPKHGVFIQNVKAHLDGNSCPKCKTSKLEKRVLKELKNTLNTKNIIQFYKSSWLGKQHLDIFLPDFNTGIECHGIQHYEIIEKFDGEKGFKRRIELDSKKRKLCLENDIRLIEIPYFYNKKEIIRLIKTIK